MGCKISEGDFFFLSRVFFNLYFFIFLFLLYEPQVDPFSLSHFFIFAYRMTRGHEEVSIG